MRTSASPTYRPQVKGKEQQILTQPAASLVLYSWGVEPTIRICFMVLQQLVSCLLMTCLIRSLAVASVTNPQQGCSQHVDTSIEVHPDLSTTWHVVAGEHLSHLYARIRTLLESSSPPVFREFSLVDGMGVEVTTSRHAAEAGALYLNYDVKGLFYHPLHGAYQVGVDHDLAVSQTLKTPLMRCASNTNVSSSVQDMYRKHPYPRIRDFEPPILQNMKLFPETWIRKSQVPKVFRVLIAGGGTGTAVVKYAKFCGIQKNIDYLTRIGVHRIVVWNIDLSPTSLELAKGRVERLQYDKTFLSINFQLGDLQTLGMDHGPLKDVHAGGKFHAIDCSGVLHHLANPLPGMAALQRVLAPTGVISAYIYGEEGRNGVYQIQEVVRVLNAMIDSSSSHENTDLTKRVQLAKALLKSLPQAHGLRNNRKIMWYSEVDEMRFTGGDIGVVDMFFHVCDRAFNMREWSEHAELVGLEMWAPSYERSLKAKLEALEASGRKSSLKLVQGLHDLLSRASSVDWAYALELVQGNIALHNFYLTHPGQITPVPRNDITLESLVTMSDDQVRVLSKLSDDDVEREPLTAHFDFNVGDKVAMDVPKICARVFKAANSLHTELFSIRELWQVTINMYPQLNSGVENFIQDFLQCWAMFDFSFII